MATITPTVTGAGQEGEYDGVVKLTWANILSGDTCTEVTGYGSFSDRAVQAVGNFSGSASVAIHGSLDGTNFAALRDVQGTTIALTAATIRQIQENAASLKPVMSAGDGSTSVTITILARRR